MRKFYCVFLLSFLFAFTAFGEENKYIVFFAESSDIPQVVVDKILLSTHFCVAIPMNSAEGIPKNLEELVSCGKIEPAVSLTPEPILAVLEILPRMKSGNPSVFEEYILDSLVNFGIVVNKSSFGIFLNYAELSDSMFRYFAGLNLPWINVDNIESNSFGVYDIDGVTVYSLYKNFPYDQKNIINWLETKQESVIPVLLTKKHLQNVKLMDYIINLFDASRYTKPAIPLYITGIEKNLIQKKPVYLRRVHLNAAIKEKLFSAANLINNYANSGRFEKYAHNNAKSELIYLCSWDLLKDLSAYKSYSNRMFDSAYANIYRLLGDAEAEKKIPINTTLQAKEKGVSISNGNIAIASIPNGIKIYNKGLLNLIRVVSENNSIRVNLFFEKGMWDESVAFVDLYIDLNNIEGAGSTTFLPDINGFLSTESGWEYALRVYKNRAILYKYSSDGASLVLELPVDNGSVLISQKYIRGNPVNWGYQAIVISNVSGKKLIVDFLNQSAKTNETILSVKPFQIPTVRLERH